MTKDNIGDVSKKKCTGCGACASVCTKKCIKMQDDEDGFLYPVIADKNCIKCGLCSLVCQAKNKMELNSIKEGYVGNDKNEYNSINSSSGGIFPIIASFVLQQKGYVCGCIIDDKLNIKHIVTNKKEDIEKMRGSKYVQSNIGDCYVRIKELLDFNIKVLFCGTPCQVSGLKLFLRKEYSNLICLDIICHGVPSPSFFREYFSRKYGKNIYLSFREKNRYEGSSFKLVVQKNNRKHKVYATDDAYYSSFLSGFSYRESCYSCIYATKERIGDITIGDCASSHDYKSFKYGSVISSIFINTQNGLDIWKNIQNKINYEKANISLEIELNHQLHEPVNRPNQRNYIYKDFKCLDEKEFNNKYKQVISIRMRAKRFIRKLVPLKLKGKIKKMIK